ncbi:hypothetical protein, partial [Salmonella enterica]|uniref:hypothetical protein n=1 Tax=Salmonella enterica TaxID=28901 RepID=UPI003D80A6C4
LPVDPSVDKKIAQQKKKNGQTFRQIAMNWHADHRRWRWIWIWIWTVNLRRRKHSITRPCRLRNYQNYYPGRITTPAGC